MNPSAVRGTSISCIRKMRRSRSGLKTLRTFPPGLNALWTPTTFIAAAILKSLVATKSSYGPKTSHSPVKSSARSSKAHRSSSPYSWKDAFLPLLEGELLVYQRKLGLESGLLSPSLYSTACATKIERLEQR